MSSFRALLDPLLTMARTQYYYYTFRKPELADLSFHVPDLDLPFERDIMPSAGDSHKASRLYLVSLVLIASIGPLQFGYHLVS